MKKILEKNLHLLLELPNEHVDRNMHCQEGIHVEPILSLGGCFSYGWEGKY